MRQLFSRSFMRIRQKLWNFYLWPIFSVSVFFTQTLASFNLKKSTISCLWFDIFFFHRNPHFCFLVLAKAIFPHSGNKRIHSQEPRGHLDEIAPSPEKNGYVQCDHSKMGHCKVGFWWKIQTSWNLVNLTNSWEDNLAYV